MPRHLLNISILTVLAAFASPVLAAGQTSSAGSSAASAGSDSIQSFSNVLSASSDSSTGPGPVAAGDYRLAAVEAIDDKPELVSLNMEPASNNALARPFSVKVPARIFGREALSPGDIIRVAERPYGLEFSNSKTEQAFFLVLADEWHRDLKSRVVTSPES